MISECCLYRWVHHAEIDDGVQQRKKGTVGTAVKLTTSGGSGSGSLNFSVTGSGCTMKNQLFTATKAGNSLVKATQVVRGIYAVAVSSAVVFAFTVKK
jgi:hypothetical protein